MGRIFAKSTLVAICVAGGFACCSPTPSCRHSAASSTATPGSILTICPLLDRLAGQRLRLLAERQAAGARTANSRRTHAQLAAAHRRLEDKASRDDMTGMLNRESFFAGARPLPRRGRPRRAADHRRRPLQEDQRQFRPSDRRRGAAGDRRRDNARHADGRCPRPHRRRGVRRVSRRRAATRRRRASPSASAARSN